MNDYFGKNADAIKKKKLFLFDMDGTIYRENTLFEGVNDLLLRISRSGRYVFVTNNSSKSVRDYVKKLRRMGVAADEENFFTSAVRKHFRRRRILEARRRKGNPRALLNRK